MAGATAERHAADLIARCYAGLDIDVLQRELLRRLRGIVSADVAFLATVDPVTLLFTGAIAEGPLGAATPLFLDNEFGRADVNKFGVLARSSDRVSSLDLATSGDRSSSPRHREILAPLGLGDELRAALVTAGHCWGVLCLHRADSAYGFTDRDLRLVQRVAPHIAEALRRAVAERAVPATSIASAAPGIILLDHDLQVVSISAQARYWLDLLPEGLPGETAELPLAVYAAAARLDGIQRSAGSSGTPPAVPTVRVATRDGGWLTIYATGLDGPLGHQTGVVLEPASPGQLSSLFLGAYSLTPAQQRVAALVLQGYSTKEIVSTLHISANTVQEHLTATFEKVGVRSRRELIARLLGA